MDETESIRRAMIAQQHEEGPSDRERLAAQYGAVYSTDEMQELFVVKGFMAPFCVVMRKSDGKVGSLEFQHSPRLYYNFVEDR